MAGERSGVRRPAASPSRAAAPVVGHLRTTPRPRPGDVQPAARCDRHAGAAAPRPRYARRAPGADICWSPRTMPPIEHSAFRRGGNLVGEGAWAMRRSVSAVVARADVVRRQVVGSHAVEGAAPRTSLGSDKRHRPERRRPLGVHATGALLISSRTRMPPVVPASGEAGGRAAIIQPTIHFGDREALSCPHRRGSSFPGGIPSRSRSHTRSSLVSAKRLRAAPVVMGRRLRTPAACGPPRRLGTLRDIDVGAARPLPADRPTARTPDSPVRPV